MSKALVRRGSGGGIVPAVGSALVPGLGQLINGETDKAIGVFVVSVIAGLSVIGAIPLIGSLAYIVGILTWIYAVSDAYVQGKRRR
jgi:hypothetical protein